ncbi:MAG: hypothetical protein WCA85_19820 [Paraburkholderia sp.]|uniref:hypothetical protein n=1 Tax=Paraburkholderia sp. TaxID=1926495 RepID=UPI003C3488C4
MQALFLGAGASFDCGMQLVSELTAELKRWLPKEKLERFNGLWRARGGGWSDELISMLTSLLSNKDMHYENIIGAIEVAFSRERDQEKRRNLHAINGFLLQAVRGLLMERQIKNLPFSTSALDDFGGITKLVEENKPLWIFSINHDLIIESLAGKFSIPIKSGFKEIVEIEMGSGDGESQSVSFERLPRASIEANDYDFFMPGEVGINLIKIHGALDIFAQGDELSYVKIAAQNGDASSYVQQLALISSIDLALGQRDGVRAINENIYIDSHGEIQFLRNTLLSGAHKFTPHMHQLAPPEFFELFRRCVNYASELICIGYGFGDRHIDETLVDWLSLSDDRQLKIVNPGISNCPSRFGHLFNQVSLAQHGAADYFLNLGGDSRTYTQKAMRAIRTRKRAQMMTELLGNP